MPQSNPKKSSPAARRQRVPVAELRAQVTQLQEANAGIAWWNEQLMALWTNEVRRRESAERAAQPLLLAVVVAPEHVNSHPEACDAPCGLEMRS